MHQAIGIDVSRYQGSVNWSRVHNAGVSFAFAKATQGVRYVDPSFQINWRGIARAGIIRGAYHFFTVGRDAALQARHFVQTIGTLEPDDLPPVLDLEDRNGIQTYSPSKSSLVRSVKTWLNIVENSFGVVPIIYSDPSFWRQYMTDDFGDYPLWIANYRVQKPVIPAGWETFAFWQYDDKGRVSGINANVDLNVFNGTYDQLLAFLSDGDMPAEEKAKITKYTIQSGDTLYAVSRRFGVSVEDITLANNITSRTPLRVGQVLRIPQ